jgi:hypothetical protein
VLPLLVQLLAEALEILLVSLQQAALLPHQALARIRQELVPPLPAVLQAVLVASNLLAIELVLSSFVAQLTLELDPNVKTDLIAV